MYSWYTTRVTDLASPSSSAVSTFIMLQMVPPSTGTTNTHMRGTGLIGNNEASSYSHKYIFLHTSYAIYRTHDWYPWIVFNPLMILVLSETRALNWNINVICLWIYSGNICPNILWQFEKWWMYRDSCQVHNMNDEVSDMKFIPNINLWAMD